ncbi:MAG TPA: folate family ECF transporter S component [Candidatus Copromorpha excrementigallinarum]|uniref:Folate family ECF transporter S component n=1 Tax=Candidatus Allocopromorpha excrementigallinarum TaxID=2840742 RepID=A0A9D1I3D2_9FIRM|nr:folate family ECF transporter S component [Candidatus Copromorpha excrementigallinarum]
MENKSNTSRLVIMAFLIALEIVLTRFCSVNTPVLRIGFGFLPVSVMGIMFGPVWAAAGYAVGDILGMLIFPTGAFFPGFTVTAALTGLTFGIFLHGKEITPKRVLPASCIILLGLNLFLDTFWLSILMGDGFIALLPTRIFKCLLMLPIHLVMIPLVWNRVISKLPAVKKSLAQRT